jgi:hypothetical protein
MEVVGGRVVRTQPTSDTMAALTAIFSAFPGMRLVADRVRYLPMVADDLGVTFDHIEQSGDRALDVERMLQACAQHWGGIWALVEALGLFYEGPDIERLRVQVTRHLPEPVLNASERGRLTRLLDRVSLAPLWLRRAHRIAAPWAAPMTEPPSSALDVAQDLEDLPADSGGVPCLLVFVAVVLSETGDEQLVAWFDQVTARWALDADQRERLLREAAARLGEQPVLIARLRPEPETDTVWTYVYLQWGRATPDLQYADAAPRRLAEVPRVLDELLHDRDDVRGLDLTLEFVLPDELINVPVDEWHVGDRPYQLGHNYRVVIRPPDRHADVDGLPAWETRWRLVCDSDAADPDAVHWDPAASAATFAADLVDDPRRLCAVLPGPPTPDRELLRAALTAGLPVVVWRRSRSSALAVERELVDPCRHVPVREHPRAALDLRLRQCDLTLLWDDFDRRPPIELELVLP